MRHVHRAVLLLTFGMLAACGSDRDADRCRDDEYIRVPVSVPYAWHFEGRTEALHEAVTAALIEGNRFAAQPWKGTRTQEGHARLWCWYDSEDDSMARLTALSMELGLRDADAWLTQATASPNDAAKAAILTQLLWSHTEQALPLWMALMSGDGRGLHVSALKSLAHRDHPTVMKVVVQAMSTSGYPGDGLLGAPFEHDLEGWAAAQRSRLWTVRWPTYWLLGLGAPDDTSVVDRIREWHTLGEELAATERAMALRE